jgi:hypothetical protein
MPGARNLINAQTLANCKECHKIHTRAGQAYCANCHELRLHQRNLIYTHLQRVGLKQGVAVDDLARRTGVPLETIESFFFEGQLGTMADALLFTCGSCKQLMHLSQRNGRLCVECSQDISTKTGVRIRDYRELEKESNATVVAGSGPAGNSKPTVSLHINRDTHGGRHG